MKYFLIATVLGYIFTLPVYADNDRFPPVTNDLTKKECGACHMTFQPQLLPERSWKAIMADLDNHFGEDASLDKETTYHIEEYLMKNAADNGWSSFGGSDMLRGVKKSQIPLRITKLPYWVHEHAEELSPSVWKRSDIRSKANCLACHLDADQGYYEDD